MSHPRYSSEEIVRRGRDFYEHNLLDRMVAADLGKFLAIDVETGEYEIDTNELAALKRAKAKRPDAPLCLLRIGSRSTYHLGGVQDRTP